MQKKKLGVVLSLVLVTMNLSATVDCTQLMNQVAKKERIGDNMIQVNLRDINSLLPKPIIEEMEDGQAIYECVEEQQTQEAVQEIEVITEVAEVEYVEEYIEQCEYQEEISSRIYCKFEVSFYTTAPDEGSGTGIGASGEYVQPWTSIALPKDIPFYSTAYIEGLGTFVNHDTGSYIEWDYDDFGNLVCRVDVCVGSKEEAYSLGRFYANGYIDKLE